jgi:hypothetical protein
MAVSSPEHLFSSASSGVAWRFSMAPSSQLLFQSPWVVCRLPSTSRAHVFKPYIKDMHVLVAFGLGQIRLYGIAVTTGRTVSRSMKGQIRPGTGRLNRSVCRSGDPSHMYQVPCAGESHRGQRVGEASSIVKHGESIIYTKPRGLHDDVWGGYGVFSFSHFFFCISSKRPLMTIHLEIPRSTPRHA